MKINQLKSGVFLSYISMFIGSIVSILYTPIMLRLLGQSEYGLYSLAASTVSYLGLLTFGFGSAYIRFYSKYKTINDVDGIKRLNGLFLVVYNVAAVLALIVGWILVANAQLIFGKKLSVEEIETAKILMALLIVNLALSFPFSLFDAYITANECFFFQRLLQIIKAIANPFIVLPLLLLGFQSVGMVIGIVVLNISIELINMVFCIRKLDIRFLFGSFNWKLFKEIAVFSSFIFINIVIDQINWNIDRLILGVMQGTIAVAIYGLAAQLNSYYISFSTAISSVFIPKINLMVEQAADNNNIEDLFVRVGRIQFIVMALIMSAFIFFGRPFIYFWGGSNYEHSYAVALLLMLPATVPLIQNLGIEIQRARNKHKFRAIVYLVMAAVNVAISIPLCKIYSALGCALGTAISMIIGNGIIMNIYYHKKLGLNMLRFWKQIALILPALIIPVVIGILIISFIDLYNMGILAVCILVYIFVFVGSFWKIGMNQDEKELIKSPLKRLVHR